MINRKLRIHKSSINQNADSRKSYIFAALNLKIEVVMCSVQIQVFLNEATLALGKRIFERIIQVDSVNSIPFEETTQVMQFMYGPSIIINFKITLL